MCNAPTLHAAASTASSSASAAMNMIQRFKVFSWKALLLSAYIFTTQCKYLGLMSTFLGISEYAKKQKKTKITEFDEICQKSHGSLKREKGISKRVLG